MTTQAEKVKLARNEGVAMGSVFQGRIIGWTTDEMKATACSNIGCEVSGGYNATWPRGWEIVAHPDPPDEEVEDD